MTQFFCELNYSLLQEQDLILEAINTIVLEEEVEEGKGKGEGEGRKEADERKDEDKNTKTLPPFGPHN